jgi:polar amino acid transport system substrate-binding protein
MKVKAFLIGVLLVPSALMSAEVLVKNSPPFSMKSGDGSWAGVSIELWERAAGKAGLQFSFVEKDLDELLKAVADKKALAGVSALSISAEREKILDFSLPYYTASMGFAVPREKSHFWSALSPFFSLAFVKAMSALCLVILVFGSLLWFFERKRNSEQFGGTPAEGIGSAFWWSAVTMTTVGYGDKAPVTVMGRVVGVVWMFAALIIVSSFTAAITSSLTINQIGSGVDSLDDLRGSTIGVTSGSTAEGFLRKKGFRTKGLEGVEEGLVLVETGEIQAYVHDLPVLNYANREGGHGLKTMSIPEAPTQRFAFALPPGSPHREALNVALLEVMEDPVWKAILHEHVGEQP